MAKFKVFVHATDADADADTDADGRAMTLAPRTYMSRLAKKWITLMASVYNMYSLIGCMKLSSVAST